MFPSVAIIDSGGANINSVVFAFQRLGVQPRFTGDWDEIRMASHVVLPGVGAAGAAMRRLDELGLRSRITKLTQPVLGICLGMQLLFESSAEDGVACLGIIPAKITALESAPQLTVPHIGWNRNDLTAEAASRPLLRHLQSGFHGYFVHSFAAPCGAWTMAAAQHGVRFSSIVAQDNFYGIQFHPERSGSIGQQLLMNFLAIDPARAVA